MRNNTRLNFIKSSKRNNVREEFGIALIDNKTNTTKMVSEFYKLAPFPNYNDFDTKLDLLRAVIRNDFLKDVKGTIGFNKKILEVGSGTSQMSLALAIGTNNKVVALDPTFESLKLGKSFAINNKIDNVTFLNADIFDDPLSKNYFDFIWCSGVLHHTQNSEKAFKIIIKWLKKNGIVFIGLYNFYGRFRTKLRQRLYALLGKGKLARATVSFLDPYLRKNISKKKKEAWFRDQYEHPVERTHSLDEILKWFEAENIEFLGSIPGSTFEAEYQKISQMKGAKGSYLSRILSQVFMVFSRLGSEGGLFMVIGKKKL